MPWFSASLLFRAIHNGIPTDADLWEERIVVVNAKTKQDATNECSRIAQYEEHEYLVGSDKFKADKSVRWSFAQIERLCEIEGDVLSNGLEVFTRYLRNSEVKSILTPFD
jgi:hypothetical protein